MIELLELIFLSFSSSFFLVIEATFARISFCLVYYYRSLLCMCACMGCRNLVLDANTDGFGLCIGTE